MDAVFMLYGNNAARLKLISGGVSAWALASLLVPVRSRHALV